MTSGPAPLQLTHLDRLEAESIFILRETVAEAGKPVMLYSIGKDSAVMLHLARKAFYPAPPPFPLLHVDTTWKFRAMYELRDRAAAEAGMELIVYRNPEAERLGINPFDHGSAHTERLVPFSLSTCRCAGCACACRCACMRPTTGR